MPRNRAVHEECCRRLPPDRCQGMNLRPETKTLPLDQFPAGTRGIVRNLAGGNIFVARMASLGVSIGSEVLVRQNYGRGPLIVVVRDTRIALGRGEAAKVLAEEIANERKSAGKE